MNAIQKQTIKELKHLGLTVGLILTDSDALNILEKLRESLTNRMKLVNSKQAHQYHNILHRYMLYNIRINAINDGFLFFKRNETNGRLDSNLTSLPSFLRPYLISTERLMYLDIKNSQPFFLYTLLKNRPEIDKEELEIYAELVLNGTLYEYLISEYRKLTGNDRNRKQMKLILCKIFYSRNESFQAYKSFFASLFPTIMQYIIDTNAKEHKTLAIQLQTMESFTVLDKVMVVLQSKSIKPFTIHDGFICKESQAVTIKAVFNQQVQELYGVAPSLHCDYIDKPEEEDDDEEEIIISADEMIDAINSWQLEQDIMEDELEW